MDHEAVAKFVCAKRARREVEKETTPLPLAVTASIAIINAPPSVRPSRSSGGQGDKGSLHILPQSPLKDLGRVVAEHVSASSKLWAARAAAATSKSTMKEEKRIEPKLVYFARQREAFDAVDAAPASPQMQVFSEETAVGGVRRFIAATCDAMWSRVLATPPHARHYYEIIREDTPCHLYFDLEFSGKDSNARSTVDAIGYLLWRVTCSLKAQFGVALTTEGVVHLESSTETKFSRHLICHLHDGSRFRSTHHAGAFVQALVADLRSERGLPDAHPLLESLWHSHQPLASSELSILDHLDEAQLTALESGLQLEAPQNPHASQGEEQFLVDTAVYTRNRAMRMYLSCKFGKTAPLLPAACNTAGIDAEGRGATVDATTLDYWLSYSRANFSGESSSQVVQPAWAAPQVQVGSRAWEACLWRKGLITDSLPPLWASIARAAGAAKPAAPSPEDARAAAPTHHPTHGFRLLYAETASMPASIATKSGVSTCVSTESHVASTASTSTSRIEGEGSTAPFPLLVEWVCKMAAGPVALPGSSGVRVSRWSALAADVSFDVDGCKIASRVIQSISFIVAGTRWCGSVGRHHKSNAVFWVVNLVNGTAAQRCFDQDCRSRGTFSCCVTVPADCLPQQAPSGGVLISTLTLKAVVTQDDQAPKVA